MKQFILITNLVAGGLFFWFVGDLSSQDPTSGGLGFILFIIPFLLIMILINVILYVIYRVTRSKSKTRPCPACATSVPVGVTSCDKCGFDFIKAAGN